MLPYDFHSGDIEETSVLLIPPLYGLLCILISLMWVRHDGIYLPLIQPNVIKSDDTCTLLSYLTFLDAVVIPA